MKYKDLTERIIGCAHRVYNKMGFGFLESIYEKCLLIELKKAKFQAVSQNLITVYYDNIDKQDDIYLVYPVILSKSS